MTPYWHGAAVLSDDGLYRYKLSRDLELPTLAPATPRVVWICLNPSTADALQDDPTIRKLKGFTARWGYHAFDIVNVFAYRTKSPKVLLEASGAGVDVMGPENDRYLTETLAEASMVVCAWGSDPIVKHHRYHLAAALKKAPCGVVALKMTDGGAPWHPLYVPYAQTPVAFTL